MKIVGIIPARKGSKRVPDKNFKMLAGKPLFAYVAEAALQSTLLDIIVLSTDHGMMMEYCREHYSKIRIIERPAEYCTDQSPAIEYVQHVLSVLKTSGTAFDGVAILQPSSPLTRPEDIDQTISLLMTSGADSAVSVVKLDHMVHPVKMKKMEQDRLIPFLEEERGRMAAHELPEVFVRNCAVYVSRREVIEQGKVIGDDCRGFVMPTGRSIDINEEPDFEFVDFLLNKQKK